MNILYSSSICNSGSIINEDIINIDKHGAWILDGASGLNGRNLIDKHSDAKWYVTQWNEYLKKNIHRTDIDLKRIIKKGISVIKDRYYKNSRNSNVTSLDLPSSSIVLMRWNRDVLEYFILGDCTLIIENNNKLDIIKDDSVTRLDNNIFQKMDGIMKKDNKTLSEARTEVQDLIVDNRLMKNTDQGYWILEFNTEAVDKAIYNSIRLKNDTKILMASDGFSAIADRYKHINIEELIYESQRLGLDNIYKRIREIEEQDFNGNRFPRFKKNDDASAIYIELVKQAMVKYV